jgi:hypothetical protein
MAKNAILEDKIYLNKIYALVYKNLSPEFFYPK